MSKTLINQRKINSLSRGKLILSLPPPPPSLPPRQDDIQRISTIYYLECLACTCVYEHAYMHICLSE